MALLATTSCATTPSAGPLPVPPIGITLPLGQPWNATPDADFQPATVRLAWTPADLLVEADLTDRDVFSRATGTRTATGWRVVATVPARVFRLATFESGLHLRVSFSRYDATTDRDPVLSTTAAHANVDFHQPGEWTPVVLTNP
jgi:hypothetical protein